MYYVTLLANFDNYCTKVWARREAQWKGKNYSLSFSEEVEKKLSIVFSDVIFYPRALQKFRVLKTIPVPACLVAVIIWHSCYRA